MKKANLIGGSSLSCPLCGWSAGARRRETTARWRPRRAMGSLALVEFQQERARKADAARDNDVAFIHEGRLI